MVWFILFDNIQIYGAEFIETSAKTGYNVGTALLMLVRCVHTHTHTITVSPQPFVQMSFIQISISDVQVNQELL